MKYFFSVALFLKLFGFFIGGSRVHDSEALPLFLIDAGVVKRMNIKLELGYNWSKRVNESPCSEGNNSVYPKCHFMFDKLKSEIQNSTKKTKITYYYFHV